MLRMLVEHTKEFYVIFGLMRKEKRLILRIKKAVKVNKIKYFLN